jgi:hypothetical protein
MWNVRYSTNSYYPEHRPQEDDGRLAYRPLHVEANKALPVPFARLIDCEKAVLILNRECPLNGVCDARFADIYAVTKCTWARLRERLITECCQW